MLITTLKGLLANGTSYPVAYQFFREVQTPPYIVFALAYTNNFHADDMVYRERNRYNVYLYTKTKDPTAEGKVESVFNTNHINWDKTETFLQDEELFQIVYTIFER